MKINFLVAGGSIGVGGRVVEQLFVSRVDPWQLFGSNLGETENGYFSEESW